MEIGVKELAFTQHRPFDRLGFLDFNDHVRLLKHVGGGCSNARAGCLVSRVVSANARTRASLDDDLVAMGDIFANRAGGQTDTIFMILDFLGASDAHVCSLFWRVRFPDWLLDAPDKTMMHGECPCKVTLNDRDNSNMFAFRR